MEQTALTLCICAGWTLTKEGEAVRKGLLEAVGVVGFTLVMYALLVGIMAL